MGYVRHNVIIVSATYEQSRGQHWIDIARDKAVEIFNQPEGLHGVWDLVSPVITSPVNDVRTFLIAPDGSKEGWGTSDEGDARRAAFIAWLEAQRYDDLSSPLSWVEVQYGDERYNTLIVNDSDARQRAATTEHAARGEGQ